ncbi:hypothetical protein GWK47_035704 [Chionoecetes opilio]|uniref:Uncharacterized protein n=1 Tax=Chionoecetes opilio TaxID=41210 RepID=A0A8J5D033_CHIOP|nr:hypothetical protein GWK47_035704 [Chionoecetes opilio]
MGHVLLYIKLVFPCFLPCFGVVCVSEILETSGSNSLRLLPCSNPKDTKGVLRAAPLAVNVWPVNSYQRYYFLLLQQALKVIPTSEDHHDAYKKAEAKENVGNTKVNYEQHTGTVDNKAIIVNIKHSSIEEFFRSLFLHYCRTLKSSKLYPIFCLPILPYSYEQYLFARTVDDKAISVNININHTTAVFANLNYPAFMAKHPPLPLDRSCIPSYVRHGITGIYFTRHGYTSSQMNLSLCFN